jgi:DNA replication protein DnaC
MSDERIPSLGEAINKFLPKFEIIKERVRQQRIAFYEGGGNCWRCRDRGLVMSTADDPRAVMVPCPEDDCLPGREQRQIARAREYERLIAASGTAGFDLSLATWPGSERVRSAIIKWGEEWPEWGQFLLLYGVTGSGKSQIAAYLLRQRIRQTMKAGAFVSVPQMISDLRRKAGGDDEATDDLYRQAYRSRALVLDDLGIVSHTTFTEQEQYTIINDRYVGGKWTIFTTNLDPGTDELTRMLGERVYGRIVEKALVVEAGKTDLRISGHPKNDG